MTSKASHNVKCAVVECRRPLQHAMCGVFYLNGVQYPLVCPSCDWNEWRKFALDTNDPFYVEMFGFMEAYAIHGVSINEVQYEE